LIEAKKKMLISLQTASRLSPQKPLRARTLASPPPASEQDGSEALINGADRPKAELLRYFE
jgi:hypothetical protein